jgi:UDP-2,3-diacylglucosamine pyrophosphatase LpxH
MLPDFELIKHDLQGGHDVTIIPVSDVHLGAAECMEQEFMEFIRMVADKPNVYLTLGGDLLNNATKSSVSNIYDEVYRPSEAKRMMAKLLEPVRDRILCAVGGNHERRSSKDVDDDITYDIMAKLDIENLYRENIAFLKLSLGLSQRDTGTRTSGFQRPTYCIAVTHGSGGGVLTGAGVNRNERFGYALDGVDALIVGHTHKPYTTQPGKISVDLKNDRVSVKPFRVISSTSWLEYSGYASAKMMLPTTHCLQTLVLRGDKKEIIVTM